MLYSVPLTPWQATVTHASAADSWTHTEKSGSFFCRVTAFFFFPLGPGAHKVLFVPFKSLFPQSYASSVIKSHWPSRSNSLGFSVLLPDFHVGKSIVGPRTFATFQELLCIIVLQFVGILLRGFMVGLMTTSSKRTLCLMPCLPGLLQPEPSSPWQAAADPRLCRRHSDT